MKKKREVTEIECDLCGKTLTFDVYSGSPFNDCYFCRSDICENCTHDWEDFDAVEFQACEHCFYANDVKAFVNDFVARLDKVRKDRILAKVDSQKAGTWKTFHEGR